MIPAVDNLQASEQPLSFDFVRKLIGRRSMDALNFSQIIPLGEFSPPWQKFEPEVYARFGENSRGGFPPSGGILERGERRTARSKARRPYRRADQRRKPYCPGHTLVRRGVDRVSSSSAAGTLSSVLPIEIAAQGAFSSSRVGG
jgi:hypothetical protein